MVSHYIPIRHSVDIQDIDDILTEVRDIGLEIVYYVSDSNSSIYEPVGNEKTKNLKQISLDESVYYDKQLHVCIMNGKDNKEINLISIGKKMQMVGMHISGEIEYFQKCVIIPLSIYRKIITTTSNWL